jgi:hypothetical protein
MSHTGFWKVGEGRRKREVHKNKGKMLNLIHLVQQDDVLVNNAHWYTIDLVNILTYYYYRCTHHSTLNPFFLDSFIIWGSSTGGLLGHWKLLVDSLVGRYPFSNSSFWDFGYDPLLPSLLLTPP